MGFTGLIMTLRIERLHQQSEFSFAMIVRYVVFVEWINFDLFLCHDVIVDAEDRARRANIVPEAIADDRPAFDSGRQVQAVKIAERADDLLVQLRECFAEAGDFWIWPSRRDGDRPAKIAEEGNIREGKNRPL